MTRKRLFTIAVPILLALILLTIGWWVWIKKPELERIAALAGKIDQSTEYTVRLKYVGWFREPTTFKVKVAWGKWSKDEEKVFEFDSKRGYSPSASEGSFKIHWKRGDRIVFQVFINGWHLLAHAQQWDDLSLKAFHGTTVLRLEPDYQKRSGEFENGQGPEVECEVVGFSGEDWRHMEGLKGRTEK